MMNIIRADVYAIVRGKALYITMGAMLLLHILVIGVQTTGGVNFSGIEGFAMEMPDIGFDGLRSAALLYTRTDNTAFFLLPLIVLAAAPIFTFGTVKNDVAWGICRTKLYLAKLLISVVLCVFMLVFYMGTGMGMATVLNGFGGPVPEGFWLNMFQVLGAQLFLLLAMTCVGVFLIFWTKNTAAAISIFISLWAVPTVVVLYLHNAGWDVLWLLDFDLFIGVNRLGFLSQLETRSIVTILSAGAAYIVFTTLGGIALFRRAEIK